MMKILVLLVVVVAVLLGTVSSCSNLIVSPGGSKDGSSIVAYNADSGGLYGSLYHYPAADHPPGTLRDVYEWDTGRYLGQIEEAAHTYNVVGNINEYGLIIGETTFGGLTALSSQQGAIVDYGSLIWITLQRARTAREAIQTISDLMATYGYASEGESFSIADQNEAWIMEIIGKGNYEKGAVWVARKVPDGYISAHANQARITTFPLNDSEDTLYAPDVISFARKIGVYPEDSPDDQFSFSDVYDAVTFDGARFCDARVWSIFTAVLGQDWSNQYLDYAQGYNLTNRLPLFVKPPNDKKVSLTDAMQYMRSHYENTQLDMTGTEFSDVGAYTYSPFRAHPLTWTSTLNADGTVASGPVTYFHERPIATPQTGWNFVAQSRKWMPREFAGVIWFGVDDSGTTVRFPVYGSATRVAEAFAGKGAQDGVVPPMLQFNIKTAFYVFNLVANWAYGRWDLIFPEVNSAIQAKETQYLNEVQQVDKKVLSLVKETDGLKAAIEYATSYSVNTGNQLVADWFDFFGQLFVKYRDGYQVTSNPSSTACGCSAASVNYPQQWRDRIVENTGSHYLYGTPESSGLVAKTKGKVMETIPKMQLKSFK